MKKVFANWTYKPKDFFTDSIFVEEADYIISIKDGKVELIVEAADDDEVSDTHSKYEYLIESFFMRALLNKRMDYELKVSTLKSKNDDGSSTIYMKMNPIKVSLTTSIVKLGILDEDGNEIIDDEEYKKRKQYELLEKLQKALNKTELLKGLFDSYKNSIKDPENELVHLYEIRDGLHRYFGSNSNSISALGMTAKEWNDLGRLCNGLPLNEGRHRGLYLDQLRDATKEEMKIAREISIKMIEAFIQYLSNT